MKSNDLVLEKDWKLFRKRLPEWQERHMQSLLDEYAAIIAGDGNPSTKFWELKERLKKDVRHVGVQAEMSRSRMVLNLMSLLHEKVITMSDLDGFSKKVYRKIGASPRRLDNRQRSPIRLGQCRLHRGTAYRH